MKIKEIEKQFINQTKYSIFRDGLFDRIGHETTLYY